MSWLAHTLALALLALIIERLVGYPALLQRRIGHPVQWMGAMIAALERRWNDRQPHARRRGVLAMALLLLVWGGLAWTVHWAAQQLLPPFAALVLEALVASSLLAQRSLREHVMDVLQALPANGGDLACARAMLARIVGRDVASFDEGKVVHAAIESLAENTSDGVVAPLFWLALAGLPGIVIYKLVNTADSMIGHLDARYRFFGWAAARLDDVLNWLPARLTGLLIALLGGRRAGHVWRITRRDARKHVSPNAGWPEAAMAASLGLRLGGPRSYQGRQVSFPWLGEGRTAWQAADLGRAVAIYDRLLWLLPIMLLALLMTVLLADGMLPFQR